MDWGGKRIGLAVGESDHGVCSPRPILAASGTLKTDAQELIRIQRQEQADRIVLGIPENEEDLRLPNVCRKLAQTLRDLGADVVTQDETLTSSQADERMLASDLTAAQKSRRRDSEAACLILERYFHAQGH